MYGHTNPTIRTTEDGETVGPKMHQAVKAANDTVWPSRNQLAKAVGPNGSQKYGYDIVNRCIRKGLISRPDASHEQATPQGSGAITITEKGKRYLNNHS